NCLTDGRDPCIPDNRGTIVPRGGFGETPSPIYNIGFILLNPAKILVKLHAVSATRLCRFGAQTIGAAIALAAVPLSALEPAQSISQYAHASWSRENGRLPN